MAVQKRNIFLRQTADVDPFKSRPVVVKSKYPKRDVQSHAEILRKKLEDCRSDRSTAAIRYKDGVYLRFFSAAGCDLATKSLENLSAGIRLCNINSDEQNDVVSATVYIPKGQENYFLKKVESYAGEVTKSGNPKNNNLISSIEDIKLAMLDAFWVGSPETMPTRSRAWCEIWLRYDESSATAKLNAVIGNIEFICQKYEIQIDRRQITFPERVVKMIYANSSDLKVLIGECQHIGEIRRAQEVPGSFEQLGIDEQEKWCRELLRRTNYSEENVSVCLLDTGVNAQHPLLAPAMKSKHVYAVESSWKPDDAQGHGTRMAGIALFWALNTALMDNSTIEISHEIESVKILPDRGGNKPELYGSITKDAVLTAEIGNPSARRVICMAVTSPDNNIKNGRPTSWSAALDSIISGAEEENIKRLFIVSAGNVDTSELYSNKYPDANLIHSVEDPGQAWNAITVGAYTRYVVINNPLFDGFNPLAQSGEMSPFSSTSNMWSNKWPVKPDVLFEGGNVAAGKNIFSDCEDLSLLTTYHKTEQNLFATINGTSSASAQASWFCAQLLVEYPDMWPETVRALMIHSASWTDQMKAQFCSDDRKTTGRHQLLRTCGYGVPDLDRAIQCKNNSVNMIIQDELQPYNKNGMNEMHIHTLPWPSDVLRLLGEVPVTLKITLSYFIEPGPGEVGWKDKYRYQSCGLRFDVNNSNEDLVDFKKRINVMMRDNDKQDKGTGTSGSGKWYLGPDNRDVGSIHSDFIELPAADLCDCRYISVFPVGGWWKERSNLGRQESKVRYSLVVSLSTPVVDADFYTPIMTEIQNAAQNVVSIP